MLPAKLFRHRNLYYHKANYPSFRTGHITYDKILTMALTLQRRHSSVLPKPQPYSTVVISRDALHDCGMTLERVSYSTRTHSMPSLLEEFAKYQNKTAEHL